MQIVIEIPDRIYYGAKNGITVNGSDASQILIDAIKNSTPLPKGHGKGYEDGRKDNEWIPVSERLPDDRRVVEVTAYWHETYQTMQGSYYGSSYCYSDGEWWCVPFNNTGEHMRRLDVIAWRELSKPYKKGGE